MSIAQNVERELYKWLRAQNHPSATSGCPSLFLDSSVQTATGTGAIDSAFTFVATRKVVISVTFKSGGNPAIPSTSEYLTVVLNPISFPAAFNEVSARADPSTFAVTGDTKFVLDEPVRAGDSLRVQYAGTDDLDYTVRVVTGVF